MLNIALFGENDTEKDVLFIELTKIITNELYFIVQ
jgi:hypothetical protein